MSLKTVHLIFIIISSAMMLFFSFWAYQQSIETGVFSYKVAMVSALLMAMGLWVYAVLFIRKMKHLY